MNTNSDVAPLKVVPILYLDIDGTVRHGKGELGHFVSEPDDVVIFPEAIEEMKFWKSIGGRIIGVSNQGGIALGYMTWEKCTETMRQTGELCGGLFDALTWCPHHPSANDPMLSRCWCRKPNPGLLIEARVNMTITQNYTEVYPLHLSMMVGDRSEDKHCAKEANIDFMWADAWRSGAFRDVFLRGDRSAVIR